MKIPFTRASQASARAGSVQRPQSAIASRRPPEPTTTAYPGTPLTHVERAVKALEQRAQGPISPARAESVAPEASTQRQAPTQQQIKAAIAEGAATPFDHLVDSDGVPREPLVSEAEQSGKAEPIAEVPELEVERVKRRG